MVNSGTNMASEGRDEKEKTRGEKMGAKWEKERCDKV